MGHGLKWRQATTVRMNRRAALQALVLDQSRTQQGPQAQLTVQVPTV